MGSSIVAGRGSARAVCLALTILVGGVATVGRGVWRASWDSGDLLPVYVGAQVLQQGDNPYDPAAVAAWAARRPEVPIVDWDTSPVAYPAPVLALLAPLGSVSWPIARVLVAVTGVVITLLATAWLARSVYPAGGDVWMWVIAGVLLFAPLHTGVSKGNLTVLVAAVCTLSFILARRGAFAASGILAGLALVLKLQIGAAILIYYLRFSRRGALWTTVTAVMLTGATLAWISTAHQDWSWAADWRRVVESTFAPGAINDPGQLNPARYQLLNLAWPLTELTGGERLPLAAASLTAMALGGTVWWASRHPFRLGATDTLLFYAAACAILLLPVYRRSYDAVLLLPALVWCIANWTSDARRYARTGIGLLTVFATPGAAMLVVGAERAGLTAPLASSRLWTVVALPHQAWAVCGLAVLLTMAAVSRSMSGVSCRTAAHS